MRLNGAAMGMPKQPNTASTLTNQHLIPRFQPKTPKACPGLEPGPQLGQKKDNLNMQIRPNRIKDKIAAGEVATIVGGITHPDDIDAFGPIAVTNNMDGIWLEGEHGWVDASELGNLTRACDMWGLTSVCRVNDNTQGLIYRTLDRGAQGIVVPHVNNAAEAQNVVDGGKFPPIGKRGSYTSRQGLGVSNFMDVADDNSLLIILIEDIIAYEKLDEILAVDHIDVFFVAPGDFAASMGHKGDINHPDVVETMNDAYRRIVASGRTAGAICGKANTTRFLDLGVKLLFTNTPEWINEGAAGFMDIVHRHSN